MIEMLDSKGPKKKVLVVDDETSIVTYLETLLQDHGYETVTATNGEEALQKACSEKPDLITLDISMPEKSGIRFYREIKENPGLSGIPVVVVTGVTGYGGKPEDFKRFISTRDRIPPPEGFIAKPIEQPEFLEAVRNLIG
jgi:CheY-like chemotaxis protein